MNNSLQLEGIAGGRRLVAKGARRRRRRFGHWRADGRRPAKISARGRQIRANPHVGASTRGGGRLALSRHLGRGGSKRISEIGITQAPDEGGGILIGGMTKPPRESTGKGLAPQQEDKGDCPESNHLRLTSPSSCGSSSSSRPFVARFGAESTSCSVGGWGRKYVSARGR